MPTKHSRSVILAATLCLLFASAVPASEVTTTATPRTDDWWVEKYDAMSEQAQNNKWDLVFVGDSITDYWDEVGKDVWKEFYGKRNAGNLGLGGDHTQHVVYRVENGNMTGQSPKLAVVLIGTNNLAGQNSPADVFEGNQAVVKSLLKVSPTTKILLLGVFPRGHSKDDPFRKQIAEVNKAISTMADGETIHYMDIGDVFLEAEGSVSNKVMPDALHLSEEGYRRWAKAIEPKVAELMGEAVPVGQPD